MDTLTSAAASGIRARIESLDMLANNIANASSPGFKTDRESFGLYLSLPTVRSWTPNPCPKDLSFFVIFSHDSKQPLAAPCLRVLENCLGLLET